MATYSLSIISNNSTRTDGDALLIEFNSEFSRVAGLTGVSFTFVPATGASAHNIDLRWSNDKMSWAAWEPYSIGSTFVGATTLANVVESNEDFFLQFKITRVGTGEEISISEIQVHYTQNPVPEVPFPSPFVQSNCQVVCQYSTNYCNGVVLGCDPLALYRPYDSMGPAIKLYNDLACAASEMFGHCVRYFRIEPEQLSADAILKEYTIFDATDVKDIKIMVPNNEFPDNQFNFMPADMDFEAGLEVHIVPIHFERAFGARKSPQEKDFLYFPLLDRIYEVNSAYLFRDFMAQPAYHRVYLTKWQDRANVLRTRANPEIDAYVDSITTDFEELLRGDMNKEIQKITKPLQYRTISVGANDHVRSHIHEDLLIEEQEISNYFTMVAQYNYQLAIIPLGEPAAIYKTTLSGATARGAISFWIKPEVLGPTSITSFTIVNASEPLANGIYYQDVDINSMPSYVNSNGYTMFVDVNGDWRIADSTFIVNVFSVPGPLTTPFDATSWVGGWTGTNVIRSAYQLPLLTSMTGSSGISVSFGWGPTGPTGVTGQQYLSAQFMDVTVGPTSFGFTGITGFSSWTGVVLNLMPEFNQLEATFWEMRPLTEKTTNLRQIYRSVIHTNELDWSSPDPLSVLGIPAQLTNLRVWKESIEEEKQPLILNQYVVRDSHLLIMADNAIPPLRLPRDYVR